ncbi:MAG: GGDEF domain-containing protein [Frankiales bacterium]|nr:MAG: GGDEF domain-containing protein [Frankiales bacterium]
MTSRVAAAPAAVPHPRTQRYSRCAVASTVAEACEGMADDLRETFELPSIYLLVDGRLRCQAARGYFQVVDGFTPSAGIIGRVVARGEPVHVEDAQQDPNFIAAIPGLAAEACVPVRVFDEVVGALSVESMTQLPADVVEVLTVAAQHLGAAIERVGGMPPVPLAQRLARIAVGLTSLTDAAEIRRRAVDGAREVSGMSSASLNAVGPDGTWVVVCTAGPLAEALAQWTHEEHQVIAAWVEAGTSSHFPGGVDVPRGYEFLLRSDVRAIAVQPLAVAGRVTGLLITADTHPVPHDPSVGAAVELLAAQTAASLANAEAMAELSRRAEEDPLTGLRNAASFAADLAAATPGTACLLIDIDHFKAVNDSFGHIAGDRLLCALADELTSNLRGDARLYRVGGDELAALLPATAEQASTVGLRLVEAARRVRTTVSIGGALVGDVVAGRDTPEAARLHADRALYRAKSAGRDRFLLAGDEDR